MQEYAWEEVGFIKSSKLLNLQSNWFILEIVRIQKRVREVIKEVVVTWHNFSYNIFEIL